MIDRTVSVTGPDGAFDAYLSIPSGVGPWPAAIVLQEIFGVNAVIRGACAWLAANGYLAIAPDLFWRQAPGVQLDESERDAAMALMKGLDEGLAVADCEAVLDHVRALPESTGKAGAVGYCLGGKLAFLMAARTSIDAAVSYYGVGIQNALELAPSVRCPLLLHIGTQDPLCPPDAQARIADALGGSPSVELETYTAGHAFARSGSPAYSAPHAGRANAVTLTFLGRSLAS